MNDTFSCDSTLSVLSVSRVPILSSVSMYQVIVTSLAVLCDCRTKSTDCGTQSTSARKPTLPFVCVPLFCFLSLSRPSPHNE